MGFYVCLSVFLLIFSKNFYVSNLWFRSLESEEFDYILYIIFISFIIIYILYYYIYIL